MENLKSSKSGLAPALTLMLMAPLLTEVLPGATRFSSIFVLPIEICVWGGGALLIRYVVRRWQLGWKSMLCLAIALAIAEECLIQQTSLAPMVIRLKGVTYARAFGINYVYFVWALIYEPVFVVFLSVYLVELIFPGRREGTWVSKGGFFAVIPLFFIGSGLAWFSWTHIARTKVFHIPAFNAPLIAVMIAVTVIGTLIFMAFKVFKNTMLPAPLKPLPLWLLGIAGAIWSVPLYGIVLLGFGIAPGFPPLAAIAGGLILGPGILFLVPRWAADTRWQSGQQFALIAGTIMSSMLIGFLGFIYSGGPDLYFKIVTNVIAAILLVMLGIKIKRSTLTN
jgi:hypothetical protein